MTSHYKKAFFFLMANLLFLASSNTSYASTLDCTTVTDVPVSECVALLQLYDSANGLGWSTNTNWDSSTSVSTWFGVTVVGGSVTSLNLFANNLVGTLPAGLSDLKMLEVLNLAKNQLSGPLPDARSAWTNMITFNIASNQLSGPLPDARSTWANIEYFTIAGNQLSGPLPSSRSTWANMVSFMAGSNQLSGPLPDARSNWTSMVDFNVAGNQLSGPLPASRSAWTSIVNFGVSSNQISGPLPDARSNWTSIQYFDITNNQISGPLPASRSAWTTIFNFYGLNNQLNGVLPDSRGAWTTISFFDVTNNQISGPLPVSRSSRVNIALLFASNNLISGLVPDSRSTQLPNRGKKYISVDNNCMEITGYTAPVESWVDGNVLDEPQNDCIAYAPTILSPTNGQILSTGTLVTVNGTGEVGATVTVTLSGNTMTGMVDSGGLRSVLFTNIANGSYTVTAFQTDLSTNVSPLTNQNFSIATPVVVVVVVPTPSGGGGGGGGSSLIQDTCPNGDFSISYYDSSCGNIVFPSATGNNQPILNINGGTGEIVKPLVKEKLSQSKLECRYRDGLFNSYKYTMTDIKDTYYENAVIKMLENCLIHGESNKGTTYGGDKITTYGAMYKTIYRLVGDQIEDVSIEGQHRSTIYEEAGAKLGLRKGIRKPSNPNKAVSQATLSIVIKNILAQQKINSPELQKILQSYSRSLKTTKRKDFAVVIAQLIEDIESHGVLVTKSPLVINR